MAYDGFLDAYDGWSARGWAFDSERPNEPVEVEFMIGDEYAGSLMANEFRFDLQENAVGNGRHAFTFSFPLGTVLNDKLTARIKGTSFVLRGGTMKQKAPELIGLIAGDIVNQCNLRCPFCIVDYDSVGRLNLMTDETLGRLLELLPMINPGSFWLSCLHEPTMHPRFIEFIEAIPPIYRDRISFTTNLSKRLPENFLERLANSGVHSIRVSFDSRQPDVFAELRKKAKYEVFEYNLFELATNLRTSSRRPLLHLITMAFKDNFQEIADLVRFGSDLGSDIHEVRYIYYASHLARWGKDHILDVSEWAQLEESLAPMASPSLIVSGPAQATRDQFEQESPTWSAENAFMSAADGSRSAPEPDEVARILPDEALRFRLRWDGLMAFTNWPDHVFSVNVNKIEHPSRYFEALRRAAAARANVVVSNSASH